MKNLAPDTVRLMQGATETRHALRRLAAKNAAAGDDQVATLVANTQADLLRLAVLKDPNEQRHRAMVLEAQPFWATTNTPSEGKRKVCND